MLTLAGHHMAKLSLELSSGRYAEVAVRGYRTHLCHTQCHDH